MKRKKAVALIIIVVLIFLFSAIILSVVLTSTSAYRRSIYFRDRNIAFNLAQAGVADALYKLNYRYHDPNHFYGFRSDGECLLLSDAHNADVFSYNIQASQLGIPLASAVDEANVQLFISDKTYYDTIVSTGRFRGRTVKISVNIRTLSDDTTNLTIPLADNTDWDTKGIPEAFNKHVICADTVTIDTSAVMVKGNISTKSTKPSPWPQTWTETTWVQTGILPPVPVIDPMPFEDCPSETSLTGWIHFQGDGAIGKYRIDGGSWQNLPPEVSYSADTTTETFTFTGYTPAGNRKIIAKHYESCPRDAGVCFDGTTIAETIVNSVLADGSITLKGNISLSSNALFEADVDDDGIGTISIEPNTIFTGSDLIIYDYRPPGTILLNSSSITINGALLSNCSMTINAQNLAIDATTSNRQAAVIIYSGANATFTLNTTPAITLGNNQLYAFLCASTNQISVNIANSGNVDFINSPIQNLQNRPIFVAYSTGLSPATPSSLITIGSDSNYARIKGIVFSYGKTGGSPDGNITVNNVNTSINGCLIANGHITLNNGTLIYDEDIFTAGVLNTFKGFTGGRRIFLPLNWRIIW